MALTNDPASINTLLRRVDAIRPDSPRQWGSMSVDQMLWHVNSVLAVALGIEVYPPTTVSAAKRLFKYVAVYGPWPKGKGPTSPQFEARDHYDFEEQRDRLRGLLPILGSRVESEAWPVHPGFGPMSGKLWIRLQMRHLDYHLQQFGA
jgi:hypothetical protein